MTRNNKIYDLLYFKVIIEDYNTKLKCLADKYGKGFKLHVKDYKKEHVLHRVIRLDDKISCIHYVAVSCTKKLDKK